MCVCELCAQTRSHRRLSSQRLRIGQIKKHLFKGKRAFYSGRFCARRLLSAYAGRNVAAVMNSTRPRARVICHKRRPLACVCTRAQCLLCLIGRFAAICRKNESIRINKHLFEVLIHFFQPLQGICLHLYETSLKNILRKMSSTFHECATLKEQPQISISMT